MKRPAKQWQATMRVWREPDTARPTRAYRLSERRRDWTWSRRRVHATAVSDTMRGIVRVWWDDVAGGGHVWARVWA